MGRAMMVMHEIEALMQADNVPKRVCAEISRRVFQEGDPKAAEYEYLIPYSTYKYYG